MRFRFGQSWLAVAASALPGDLAPARAQKCGIEMPTGHSNVRNLVKTHVQPAEHRKMKLRCCRLLNSCHSFVKGKNTDVSGVRFR